MVDALDRVLGQLDAEALGQGLAQRLPGERIVGEEERAVDVEQDEQPSQAEPLEHRLVAAPVRARP